MKWRTAWDGLSQTSECGQYHIAKSPGETGYRYLAFYGNTRNDKVATMIDDRGLVCWDTADEAKRACTKHAGWLRQSA